MVTGVSTFVDNSALVNKLNAELKNDGSQAPKTESEIAAEEASLNFNTFLTMLSVQLQNQDPLNPMDGTQFTEQLATFSSLEQQIKGNSYLEQLSQANDFSQQALAVSYIGKDALIKGNVTATDGESDIILNYTLESGAASSTIELVDAEGTKVATIEGTNYVGRNEVVWDSTGDDGEPVEPGFYKIFITSYDAEGTAVSSKSYTYGRVVAVEGDSDSLIVTAADGRVSKFDDIIMVKEGASYEAANGAGTGSPDETGAEEEEPSSS